MNCATCSWTRLTTSGAELPTLVTAIPAAMSISVAVDIDDHATACRFDVHGQPDADAVGDILRLAFVQRLRRRARDLGDDSSLLRQTGSAAQSQSWGHGRALKG